MTIIDQKTIQAGAKVIQQTTQDHLKKKLPLQTAIAASAKVLGLKNAHLANKNVLTDRDSDTWLVVGHYQEENICFVDKVQAKDGFKAMVQSAKNRCGEDQECPDYFVSIQVGTGVTHFASDENLTAVNGEDLKEFFDIDESDNADETSSTIENEMLGDSIADELVEVISSSNFRKTLIVMHSCNKKVLDIKTGVETPVGFCKVAEDCFTLARVKLEDFEFGREDDEGWKDYIPAIQLFDEDEFSNVLRALPDKQGLDIAVAVNEFIAYVQRKVNDVLTKSKDEKDGGHFLRNKPRSV